MSTTINIPVDVPKGFNIQLLTRHLTETAKLFIATTQANQRTDTNDTEAIITEQDLVVDPVVASMFKNITPLSLDIDVRKEYGDYLMEKYK
ncbi:MAG: hypothetical protein K6G46_07620 [Prevotella sp.]|nr:hypothetical protein [Prevotella sp.]